MNIKERNALIMAKMDALRFGHVDHTDEEGIKEQFNPFHFDWNLQVKPPITSYLHPKVINDLTCLVSDVKIMNRPQLKFREMNAILRPMGFRPLASGTNRRAFYCEYDPTIILKIGSDRIGKADNISEYYTQSILKPFCSKIYDVLPTGIVALCERLEPMTEMDFKTKWSNEIFDLIMNLLYRGYILEDIGGNFYKNWAIRLGFGPALIDFPYVYEIDWGKLKCNYVNPITGEKCHGELDYDYSKGMSEIVCDSCGSRYSASYLRKNHTGSNISELRKGKRNMKAKFNVELVRGDQVVYSSFREVPSTFIPKPVDKTAGNGMKVGNMETPATPKGVAGEQKKTITSNTSSTESKQNYIQNIDLNAARHERNTNHKPNRYGFGSGNNGNNGVKSKNRTPIREDLIPEVTKFLDSMFKSYGRGVAIDLSRRLGLFWQDPEKRTDVNVLTPRVYGEELEKKYGVKPKTPTTNPQPSEVPTTTATTITEENKEISIDISSNVDVNEEEPEFKAQTEGLFPVKPMTQEELDKLDIESREDNVAMGFPGEPVANTMRMQQQLPILKKKIEDSINGFVPMDDETKTYSYLKEQVMILASDEIARLSGTDTEGIEITINTCLDHMNRACYAIKVENRKSPIFELTVYPQYKDENREIQVESRKIADGINLLDNISAEEKEVGVNSEDFYKCLVEKTEEFYPEMIKQTTEEDQKAFMIQSLINELRDAGLQFGVSNRIAKDYVEKHFPFKESEINVTNEL